MFKKILVFENVFSKTHPALQRAIQLAHENDVELKVVDIVESHEEKHDRHRRMRSIVELEMEDRLEKICEPLKSLDIKYSTELLRGRPYAEIVKEVVNDSFSLVIKTTSFPAPNDVTGMMGPVDLRITRNCPCAVWLEVDRERTDTKTILVAVDPQAVIDDLNTALIRKGKDLAKSLGAELHVVAAWEVADEEILLGKTEPADMEKYLQFVESSAREKLDELLKPAGDAIAPANVHCSKGRPSQVILNYAEKIQPDFVIMGTVGDVGIDDLLIGNTAHTTIRHIDRSVLMIKPDGLFSA